MTVDESTGSHLMSAIIVFLCSQRWSTDCGVFPDPFPNQIYLKLHFMEFEMVYPVYYLELDTQCSLIGKICNEQEQSSGLL